MTNTVKICPRFIMLLNWHAFRKNITSGHKYRYIYIYLRNEIKVNAPSGISNEGYISPDQAKSKGSLDYGKLFFWFYNILISACTLYFTSNASSVWYIKESVVYRCSKFSHFKRLIFSQYNFCTECNTVQQNVCII